MNTSPSEKLEAREAFYDNINLIDNFIKDHGHEFNKEDIAIIKEFKHFRKGLFTIMKMSEEHTLFMDDEFVYAVLALNDPFHKFMHPDDLPVMAQAVLLPFKGKIIYDGMLRRYPVFLGRNILASTKNDFNISKSKYGVIESLPLSQKMLAQKVDYKATLLAMMKTKASREQNFYEIEELLEEHHELYPVFMQQWGKINSRAKKKTLKELQIKKTSFCYF